MTRASSQNGLTLIELLVSMAVFSVGMLAIAMHTGQTIRSSSSNSVHANAMQIAMQATEPLTQALKKSPNALRANLAALGSSEHRAINFATTDNPVVNSFTYKIEKAVDDTGTSLLNKAPEQWQPPYSVNILVRYKDASESVVDFPVAYVLSP